MPTLSSLHETGHELVKEAGGLHKFMAGTGLFLPTAAVLIFSLAELRNIGEEGNLPVSSGRFYSFISPEKAIEIENALGAIIMAFDECVPIRQNMIMLKISKKNHQMA